MTKKKHKTYALVNSETNKLLQVEFDDYEVIDDSDEYYRLPTLFEDKSYIDEVLGDMGEYWSGLPQDKIKVVEVEISIKE